MRDVIVAISETWRGFMGIRESDEAGMHVSNISWSNASVWVCFWACKAAGLQSYFLSIDGKFTDCSDLRSKLSLIVVSRRLWTVERIDMISPKSQALLPFLYIFSSVGSANLYSPTKFAYSRCLKEITQRQASKLSQTAKEIFFNRVVFRMISSRTPIALKAFNKNSNCFPRRVTKDKTLASKPYIS